jgi:hypothetical protein
VRIFFNTIELEVEKACNLSNVVRILSGLKKKNSRLIYACIFSMQELLVPTSGEASLPCAGLRGSCARHKRHGDYLFGNGQRVQGQRGIVREQAAHCCGDHQEENEEE